uniref:Aminoglycoside phosphotransferase n=1 Tax=Pseudomonas sp. 19-rlim TaxID=1084570 RepID=G3LGY6_9PSED|nr:aminoglycoside phosphotransferase [Pseudomonas sp. 19-rlim]
MSALDKNYPAADWIEMLRLRYPCERELDRTLIRKMKLRSGPAYAPVILEALVAGTQSLLEDSIQDAFELTDARWLSGGASKLQMQFRLHWNQPGIGWTDTPMVLRMEPAESITESSRLREFQVIKAIDKEVPTPQVFWVDAEGTFLPYPAIVYGSDEDVAAMLNRHAMQGFPGELRTFICSLADINSFSMDMCQHITTSTHARRHIELLLKRNVFLIPLDRNRQRYRFHRVFQEYLRNETDRLLSQAERRNTLARARSQGLLAQWTRPPR